jgi:hypothetical protein
MYTFIALDTAAFFVNFTVLWHVDPMLGNDPEIGIYTTVIIK